MTKASWLAGLILAVALSGATGPVHAQDLLETWQLALQRDPLYAASGAGRNADQELVPQAKAQLLPYVSLNAIGQQREARRLRQLDQRVGQGRAAWALSLIQPVVDITAWGQLQRAQYIASAADVAHAQSRQDLILRVAQAYFDVLAAQDALRVLQAQKSAIETQLEAARMGFELGSTTVTDTYEAQARLDLLNANDLAARNALQVSLDRLAKIINQRPAKLAELAPGTKLPGPQPNRLDDWTAQSSRAHLAVAQAALNASIFEKQIDIAKSERYPKLQLQAQTGSGSDQTLYGMRSGPKSLDTSIGLQLSVPLYTGGEISSLVREQTSRLQEARYQLEASKRDAVQATQQYFSGVTSGLAQIEVLQRAERSSLAALQANRTAYEVGVRINIDVLNAQQQLYETQRSLLQARYDTLMNSLRLKASSGILTELDIAAVNELLSDGPDTTPAVRRPVPASRSAR